MSDPRIKKFGLAGFNKPKRTPSHPKKSHVVLAKEGDRVKLIRFGMQGAKNKPPRQGESDADKAKRRSFKASTLFYYNSMTLATFMVWCSDWFINTSKSMSSSFNSHYFLYLL